MNTIKKVLIAALIFASASFTGVFAADISVSIVNPENGTVNVSGTALDAVVSEDTDVTVIVLPLGTDLTASYMNNTLALGYAKTKNDGSYDVSFDFFNNTTKKFDFYVLYDGKSEKITFEYLSAGDIADKLKTISSGEIPVNNIFSLAEEIKDGIGLNTVFFENETNKVIFNNRIYTEKEKLNKSDDFEVINAFLALCDKAEKEADILSKLTNVQYSGERYKILKDNENLTGIDFSEYEKLSGTSQNRIISAFDGQKFSSFEQLKEFFDKKVKEEKNGIPFAPVVTPSSGKPSSGGGGGASSGGIKPSETTNSFSIYDRFTDLKSAEWSADYVSYLYGMGIVSGTGGNLFEPNGLVTREQFAKMAVMALGDFNSEAQSDFTDVSAGEWYAPYVASAKNAGLVSGMGDGTFGVGMNITRQDMAVIIYNALKKKNIEFTEEKTDFSDYYETDEYAKESVSKLSGAGVINGKGNGKFEPKSFATRAEASVLIYALVRR